jgi:hypothetical protein
LTKDRLQSDFLDTQHSDDLVLFCLQAVAARPVSAGRSTAVKAFASATRSSFAGNAAFTAAAKQGVRGMRVGRRSAVQTQAKVGARQPSCDPSTVRRLPQAITLYAGIMQVGDSLAEFLVEATPDTKLRQLLMSMSEAIRTIAFKVRRQAAFRECWAPVCCACSSARPMQLEVKSLGSCHCGCLVC